MYLMFADEADREQGRGAKFFVYGAIFVDVTEAWELHNAIAGLRKNAGLQINDSLKFADKSRPRTVTREAYKELKAAVMRLAVQHDVKFCAYVMLHDIAKEKSNEELVQWGANTLLGKFNQFCKQTPTGNGLAIFDRMPIEHPYRYLREKFSNGLTFSKDKQQPLERIIGLASSCDGASHLSSVADIVLGSFRYCVNEAERDIVGKAMFPNVAKLMWRRKTTTGYSVKDLGLIMRPAKICSANHKKEYESLVSRLQMYLAQ